MPNAILESVKDFNTITIFRHVFADMDAIGVLPYYDCNRPPRCVWSDEEKRWLRDLAARHVPHGICLKGSGPMLGLSFDAEQGCW